MVFIVCSFVVSSMKIGIMKGTEEGNRSNISNLNKGRKRWSAIFT